MITMIYIVMNWYLLFFTVDSTSVLASFLGPILGLLDQGGVLIWPLLLMSTVSLAIIIDRIFFWSAISHTNSIEKIVTLLRNNSVDEINKLLKNRSDPYIYLVNYLLKYGTTDSIALEAVEYIRPKLDRWLITLSSIITAAPLVGILGTVVGIIDSFGVLSNQDATGDPSAVAEGISVALITTAFGLIISLMTFFPYMIFKEKRNQAIGWIEVIIAAAKEKS